MCENLYSHDLYDSRDEKKIQQLNVTEGQISIQAEEKLSLNRTT